MPKAKVNGVNINYELDGNGEETIVLLNGIMMSAASWIDLVPTFTEGRDFQLLRVDFRDMGMSEKFEEDYDVSIHADDLKGLLDHLGLEKVHMVGISYGGIVAMLFALKHPEMLSNLMLFNSVAKAPKKLQAISTTWEEACKLKDGKKFFDIAIPPIYSDYYCEHHWDVLAERREMFDEMLTDEWFEALIRLSQSSKDVDVLDRVSEIEVPTLLVGGSRDYLTPVYEMEKIHERMPNSRMMIIKDSGHASFFEKPDEFVTAVLGFIALNN